MTRNCITSHIDEDELDRLRASEEQERESLNEISNFTNLDGTTALRERLAA